MDERFDELAKDATRGLSRRETFARVGGGLFFALLASLGLTRASDACLPRCCQACCNSDTPPKGTTPGECMRACLQGLGQCDHCATVDCA